MDREPRLLVVDDNVDLCHNLRDIFEEQGYRVSAAHTGAEGLAALEKRAYHATLLDIRLPDGPGIDLLPAIRVLEPEMPVILITAYGSLETAIQALHRGAEGYVLKPLDVDAVLTMVRRALEKRRLVRQERRLTEQLRALNQAERQRNRELAMLNQLGQELTATLDQQQVVERLLESVTEVIGAVGASVWLWDEKEPGWLVCRAASSGEGQRTPLDMRLGPGQGVAGWVAQEGKGLVVPQADADPRFFSGIDQQTGMRTLSLIAVPLRVRQSIIGVLEIVNKLAGEFGEGDLVLVETLAASAAIAIDNAGLLEVLRQRTVELKARNEELDAFSHTAAHDLQNPLALVIGYAEVLEEDCGTLLDRVSLSRLQSIIKSGHRMSNIIDELLLLASVRDLEKVDLHPLDMGRIVSGARDRLAYLEQEHEAEIVEPESWPRALGQALWVEEVWVNYLSNAIKYGGRPPRIEIGATVQADDAVRFWVRDNGRGLTAEEQDRLFTPFTRLDQVRARGHGLGLSIVRRIVEKLGGEVGVESDLGTGSVFSFTLPAKRAKLEADLEA